MPEIVDGYQRGDAAEIGPMIEAMIEARQNVTLQISGDSMRPTLKPRRDAAVIAPIRQWPPEKGAILFFKRDSGEYVLHRVLRVKNGACIMNGDAQEWTEGPVTREMAIAEAIAIVRKGKMIEVENPKYRVYVRLWRLTKPIRRPMFACWRAIKKLAGKR